MIAYSDFVTNVNESFVYLLNCPVSGNTFYVGKANNPKVRYRKHLSQLNTRTLKNNYIKHLLAIGERPNMLVVFSGSESSCFAFEQELISIYKNFNIDIKNMTPGGDGGNTFGGKTHSLESKIKISLANKGRLRDNTKQNQLKRKKVLQLCPITGEVINEFVSVVEASSKTGCSKTNIAKMANGSIKSSIKLVGGFKWKYKD